ncbi:hypothetical protein ACWEVY_03760 [Streptomyces longwoodensis]
MVGRERDGEVAGGRGAHLSVAGLRARGWTVGMVRRLLGEPDLVLDHPSFRAVRTRLYRVERVEVVERSEEFRTLAATAARRSAVARAAALRRSREVLARIAAVPIDVPRLDPRRLATLAGVDGSEERGAAARLQVDHLWHHLWRYDALLSGSRGRVGRQAAEFLLARRILAAIAEAYPHLAQECARRLSASGRALGASPPSGGRQRNWGAVGPRGPNDR